MTFSLSSSLPLRGTSKTLSRMPKGRTCRSGLRLRLRSGGPVAEVAMACAAHDRLGAGQRYARIVAFAKRAVAAARQKVADPAEAHGAVGLGVTAPFDIEIEDARLVGDDLDRQRVILGPQMQDRLEAFEVRPAGGARRHLGAGGDRRATDGGAENLAGLRLADRLQHLVVDRRDDRRLDLAARQNAEIVGCFIPLHSGPRWRRRKARRASAGTLAERTGGRERGSRAWRPAPARAGSSRSLFLPV